MIVHSLVLENFCQHQNVNISLSPQLNMIVGPNGCGKTNLLRGLQLALTGDAGGEQTKQQNVRQRAGEHARCSVAAEIEHGGARMTVVRGVAPNVTKLVVDGETLTGATVVNKELWTRLEVTKKQLDEYVFVKQKQIDALIDKSPTERIDELSALFGIAKAKKIWRELGEALGKLPDNSLAIDSELELAQKEHDVLQTTYDAANSALQQWEHVPDDPETYYAPRRDAITAWGRKQTCEAELAEHTLTVTKRQQDIAQWQTEVTRAESDLEALQTAIMDVTPDAERAHAVLRDWAVHKSHQTARSVYETARAALLLEYRQRPVFPAPPLDNEAAVNRDATLADTWRTQLRELQSQHGTVSKTVEMLAGQLQEEKCYACGQPLPGLAKMRAQLPARQAELAELQAQAAALKSHIAAFDEHISSVRACRAYRYQWRKRAKQLQQQRAAHVDVAAPTESMADAQAIIDELDGYKNAATSVGRVYADARAQLASANAAAETVQGRIQALTTELETVAAATEEAATTARDEIVSMREAAAARQSALVAHAAARAGLDAGIRRLQAAITAKQQDQAGARVRTLLTDVRAVYQSNEMPHKVSHTYMRLMEQQINETLALFDSPFRVAADGTLGFTATFLDGHGVVPDRWLSVGERITLALAFRIAVNSTFTTNLGMLVLDEPTAGLDEHNLGCLPVALARLRELAQDRGLQVLFVTHQQSAIGQYFDTVVNLGENYAQSN